MERAPGYVRIMNSLALSQVARKENTVFVTTHFFRVWRSHTVAKALAKSFAWILVPCSSTSTLVNVWMTSFLAYAHAGASPSHTTGCGRPCAAPTGPRSKRPLAPLFAAPPLPLPPLLRLLLPWLLQRLFLSSRQRQQKKPSKYGCLLVGCDFISLSDEMNEWMNDSPNRYIYNFDI
jgi:hypothetical protein